MLLARLLMGLTPAASQSAQRIEVHPLASCPGDAAGRHVFCSLADAAAHVVSSRSATTALALTEVCLHPGVHTLREPLRLNSWAQGREIV